jgi:type IV secretion system protein VirD4
MFRFLKFIAAHAKGREALRWVIQHWDEVLFYWSGISFFGGLGLIYASYHVSAFSPWWLVLLNQMIWNHPTLASFPFGIGLAFGLAGSLPALLLFLPLLLLLSPLLGLALGMAVGPLALMVLAALAVGPGLLFAGTRGLLFHLAAKWIGQADTRDREKAAVLEALGLGQGSIRRLDGKARLMDAGEFARFDPLTSRRGRLLVGLVHGTWFGYGTEKHVLIVASTRGGKGRDLIIPNLEIYVGSVFVLDPKGENAQKTAQKREEFGPVRVLDPFGVSGFVSACFNPIAAMNPAMLVTDAQTLADALIEGEEDHWTSAARGLVTGLLLHIATAPNLVYPPDPPPEEEPQEEPEEKDLEGEEEEEKTIITPEPEPEPAPRTLVTLRRLLMKNLPYTLEAMTQNENGPQEMRDVGEWGLTAAPNEWASIVSNAIEQTKWLASPQIQAVLSEEGEQVDFSAYRDSVQSVFVCLPAPYFRTFSKWLRLVVAAALDTLTKELNPAMPYPTRFVLDEVAQLGNLEKIESALTLSAGYGVQLWGVWQHLKDIERCYPRSGVAGWVSSSGLRLVFATQDNETVKYFAGMTGEAMTETDIRHMGPRHMLALVDGQNPILVERQPGPG